MRFRRRLVGSRLASSWSGPSGVTLRSLGPSSCSIPNAAEERIQIAQTLEVVGLQLEFRKWRPTRESLPSPNPFPRARHLAHTEPSRKFSSFEARPSRPGHNVRCASLAPHSGSPPRCWRLSDRARLATDISHAVASLNPVVSLDASRALRRHGLDVGETSGARHGTPRAKERPVPHANG